MSQILLICNKNCNRGLVVKDTIIRDMDTKHCYTTKGEFIRGNIACLYRIMDVKLTLMNLYAIR